MLSKSCKYAIRATVYIASMADEGVKLSVKDIAAEIDAPPAFTGKILQILNKNKIVTSLKGPYGGFFTEKYQLELPAIEIVNAVDGESVFKECVMGLHQCSDQHPCPLHFEYGKSRDAMLETFQKLTVGELAEDYNTGAAFLKNPIPKKQDI